MLNPDPTGEIEGGPDVSIDVVPFNLKVLNLGFFTGLLSLAAAGTETQKAYTFVLPFTVAAVRYLHRDNWLSFPYFIAAIGLYTKFVVISENDTIRLVSLNTKVDVDETDDKPVFFDNYKFGPGGMLEAGFLVPLSHFLYLNLAYSIHLFYVHETFSAKMGGNIGINLHY